MSDSKAELDTQERIGLLSFFLWWCSGAVISILRKYPTEYAKYFGIGGAIFATWILATISGTYAFYFMTEKLYMALAVGLVWGWMIFNFDRFITSSMKKAGNEVDQNSMFQQFIYFLSELITALPRILIAIVISFSISIPLELRLFSVEVQEQIKEIQKKEVQKNIEQARADRDKDIEQLGEEKERLRREQDDLQKQLDKIPKLQEQKQSHNSDLRQHKADYEGTIKSLEQEYKGDGGTGKAGWGPIAERKAKLEKGLADQFDFQLRQTRKRTKSIDERIERIEDQVDQERKRLDDEIREKEEEIEKIKNDFSGVKAKIEEAGDQYGFLTQVQALYELSEKEGNEAIKWAHYIFVVLIMILELGPIIVKLMTPRGPYDAHVDFLNKKSMLLKDHDVIRERLNILEKRRDVNSRRGLQRGAKLLRASIEAKFGVVPNWVAIQLAQARDHELELWSRKIMESERIEDIFDI